MFIRLHIYLGLWDQRIPLLQHYLEQTKSIDQDQWEEWLLALMDDTLAEIDLDEWNTALIGAMTQHLSGLYSGPEQSKEKTFLMKAMGRALKATKSGNRYLSSLNPSCHSAKTSGFFLSLRFYVKSIFENVDGEV